MKLDLIFNNLGDYENYRVHLAKMEPNGYKPIEVLARSDEEWKEWQLYKGNSKERFTKDYIISFAQISGDKFLFGGIFKILDRTKELYEVELMRNYSELIGRVVINYSGDNKRGTAFTLDYIIENSEIIAIYQMRYRGELFKSIENINHSYYSMETILKNELSDWKTALSKVKGVYLLSDTLTGKHYVGSATGNNGFWGRWSEYIYGLHGNNKELIELVNTNGEEYFKNNFKFSILETVGSGISDDEIIKKENIWKEKLLSRTFGYNSN